MPSSRPASTRLTPWWRFTAIWPKFKCFETLSHSWHHFWKRKLSGSVPSLICFFFPLHLQRWQWQWQCQGHRRLLWTPERLVLTASTPRNQREAGLMPLCRLCWGSKILCLQHGLREEGGRMRPDPLISLRSQQRKRSDESEALEVA